MTYYSVYLAKVITGIKGYLHSEKWTTNYVGPSKQKQSSGIHNDFQAKIVIITHLRKLLVNVVGAERNGPSTRQSKSKS